MFKKLLTIEEENILATKVEEGFKALDKLKNESDSLSTIEVIQLKQIHQTGMKARNKLFDANTNLVYHMAKAYVNKGVDIEDLHQCGLMGLQKAAETFKTGTGAKFSTYASYWVMDSLNRCISNNGRSIRLPNKVHQNVNKFRRAYTLLENENGKAPTIDELSLFMNISKEDALKLMEASYSIGSLDNYVDSDKENTFADLIADNSSLNPLESTIKRHLSEKVYPALTNTLDEREFKRVNNYVGLDGSETTSFEQIGEELNISRERARQLFNGSLDKLRNSEYANDLISLMLISK